MQEGQGERGLFGELDWVEVQEMGFYGEGVGAEGGAIAYIGDGFEGLGRNACANREGCDVDAVGGEKFRIRGQVDGGDGVASAVTAA